MKTRIYGVEIDFRKKTHNSFPADVIAVHARLLDVCASYQELVVIRAKKHIYVLATGQSFEPLAEIVMPYAQNKNSMNVSSSSEEAVAWLLDIANGNRWPDVEADRLQNVITDATVMAKEMGCLGKELFPIMTKAWKDSNPGEKVYQEQSSRTYLKGLFNYLTLKDFDFPYTSSN